MSPRSKHVGLAPQCWAFAAAAWAFRAEDSENGPPPHLATAVGSFVTWLRGTGRGSAARADGLFALCVVADPAEMATALRVHVLGISAPGGGVLAEWLLAECEADGPADPPSFPSLHCRCFAVCALARLLADPHTLAHAQLPPWCTGGHSITSLLTRLAAVGARALRALEARGDFHAAVLAAGPPADVWSAVACPGPQYLFARSAKVQAAVVDALLASLVGECVCAALELALLALLLPRAAGGGDGPVRTQVSSLAANELRELLAGLRAYALRPGFSYGTLHGRFGLVTQLEAVISFGEPAAAALRLEEAERRLAAAQGDTPRALEGAMAVLRTNDATWQAQRARAPVLPGAGVEAGEEEGESEEEEEGEEGES